MGLRTHAGRTPLHYAALHGRAAAVEELLKQGAAHGACDHRGGYTPLHLAADAGQCEVISRLFALGADLEAVSTKGWTPLALANMKVSTLLHLSAFASCLFLSLATAYLCGSMQHSIVGKLP